MSVHRGVRGQPLGLALIVLVMMPPPALGQDEPALHPRHVVVDAAMVWSAAYGIGTTIAELRGNGPGPTPPPFTLVLADSRVTSAIAAQVRVGLALTRTLAVEFSAARASPHISVSIAADPEAPSQVLPGEQLQQYQFEGGVSWQLPVRLGRLAPFASAGGGHLRQLHEDRTLAETGQIYYVGGGARFWLRGGSASAKAIGVRGDVRMNLRRKGIDFDNTMRGYPTASIALFVGL